MATELQINEMIEAVKGATSFAELQQAINVGATRNILTENASKYANKFMEIIKPVDTTADGVKTGVKAIHDGMVKTDNEYYFNNASAIRIVNAIKEQAWLLKAKQAIDANADETTTIKTIQNAKKGIVKDQNTAAKKANKAALTPEGKKAKKKLRNEIIDKKFPLVKGQPIRNFFRRINRGIRKHPIIAGIAIGALTILAGTVIGPAIVGGFGALFGANLTAGAAISTVWSGIGNGLTAAFTAGKVWGTIGLVAASAATVGGVGFGGVAAIKSIRDKKPLDQQAAGKYNILKQSNPEAVTEADMKAGLSALTQKITDKAAAADKAASDLGYADAAAKQTADEAARGLGYADDAAKKTADETARTAGYTDDADMQTQMHALAMAQYDSTKKAENDAAIEKFTTQVQLDAFTVAQQKAKEEQQRIARKKAEEEAAIRALDGAKAAAKKDPSVVS